MRLCYSRIANRASPPSEDLGLRLACPSGFDFRTRGRGTTEITAQVARLVAASGIKKGLCTVCLKQTSASLVLCENADPGADRKLMLGTWQGLYLYEHRHAEHARSVVVTVKGDG